jgi:hypothetical protein
MGSSGSSNALFPTPKLPVISDWAAQIRAGFSRLLGDLGGFPSDPYLRTSFKVNGKVTLNGAGQGLIVNAYLYVVSPYGAAIPGPVLASGSGTPDPVSGTFSFDATGAYNATASNYTVEIDVLDGQAVVAQKTIPVDGWTLYRSGVYWTFAIATKFTVKGLVTLDGKPIQGVEITADIEQFAADGTIAFQLTGGGAVSGPDGNYSLEVDGAYNASGGPQSAFNYTWEAFITPGGDMVAWRSGAIDGATLAAAPVTWDVKLVRSANGSISGNSGVRPPPHHQRGS